MFEDMARGLVALTDSGLIKWERYQLHDDLRVESFQSNLFGNDIANFQRDPRVNLFYYDLYVNGDGVGRCCSNKNPAYEALYMSIINQIDGGKNVI